MNDELIRQRNTLRMKIWALDEELNYHLAVQSEYRNNKLIENIEMEKIQIECEIEALSENKTAPDSDTHCA